MSGSSSDEGAERSRPRPVRESLSGGGRPPPAADGRPTPVRQAMVPEVDVEPVEAPTRGFLRGDEEWVARVEGRGRTGLPGDPGRAPLLLLSFTRAGSAEPEFEVVRIGRSLEELTEDQLVEGLDRARDYRGPHWDREELFADTRKGHGGR